MGFWLVSDNGVSSPLLPVVGIVIPAFDPSPNLLRNAVESAARQTVPLALVKIIVVDDGSAHPISWEEISSAARGVTFEILRNDGNKGLHESRRIGANFALFKLNCDYIIFLDADDVLARRAIENLTRHHSMSQSEVVFGKTVGVNTDIVQVGILPGRDNGPGAFSIASQLLERSFSIVGALIPAGLACAALDYDWVGLHEDVLETTRLAALAGSLRQIESVTYFYFERSGSLSHVKNLGARNMQGLLHSTGSAVDFLLQEKRVSADVLISFVDRILRVLFTRQRNFLNSKDFENTFAEVGSRLTQSDALHILESGLRQALEKISPLEVVSASKPRVTSTFFGQDLDIALLMSGRNVFVCMADYHLQIAERLASRIPAAMILNLSHALAEGSRRGVPSEELDVITPNHVPEALGLFALANTVFLMNDYTPGIELAQEVRAALGLPIFSIMEGPSDLNRSLSLDSNPGQLPWKRNRLPYSFGDITLTAGPAFSAQLGRNSYILGMTIVERDFRTEVGVGAPESYSILISMNYSYGVGIKNANTFFESCKDAALNSGMPFLFSKHPGDAFRVPDHLVASEGIDSLLTPGKILITRFSTLIFRALARGVPVIYFSPGESHMLTTMGAFRQVSDEEELLAAIRALAATKPSPQAVRESARDFLREYAGLSGELPSTDLRFLDFFSSIQNPTAQVSVQKLLSRATLDFEANRQTSEIRSAIPRLRSTRRRWVLLGRAIMWTSRALSPHPRLWKAGKDFLEYFQKGN